MPAEATSDVRSPAASGIISFPVSARCGRERAHVKQLTVQRQSTTMRTLRRRRRRRATRLVHSEVKTVSSLFCCVQFRYVQPISSRRYTRVLYGTPQFLGWTSPDYRLAERGSPSDQLSASAAAPELRRLRCRTGAKISGGCSAGTRGHAKPVGIRRTEPGHGLYWNSGVAAGGSSR